MPDRYKNKYRIASARLPNWDYRWDAAYFVTICTKNRELFFGEISDQTMHLSETGKIAEQFWFDIPLHFPTTVLHPFVVMPNHVHGVVVIDNHRNNADTFQCNMSAGDGPPWNAGDDDKNDNDYLDNEKNKFMSSISPKPGSISTIIRSYKSAVSKHVHKNHPDFGWQARFHDHIIRNEPSFIRICDYIINNPKNWTDDTFFRQ